MGFLGDVFGGIWAKLGLAAAALAGFAIWLSGQKREAVKADRAKQTEKVIERVKEHENVERETAGLSDAELDADLERLRRPTASPRR